MPKQRPYLYYDQTISLCEHCLMRVEAKHVIMDNQVFMMKWCPEHGQSKVLIATDAAYWRMGREVYIKAPEMPLQFNTKMHWGCPYDCGLCPDHQQHSCLTVLEVTDACNLNCPICYASSGTHLANYRSLDDIKLMLDAVVANEGEPDVLQISSGEPTLHPQFFEILDEAKKRPIRHLMLNTNGIRIASEKGFAEKLATYMPAFEIYLQFDSFDKEALIKLRGVNMLTSRRRALENLNRVGLSTTLVMTVGKGINDHEIGAVVEFAAKQPCVRGVTIQPIQFAGRTDAINLEHNRLTHTEVRTKLLEQTDLFAPEDVIPVPCNPDALSMAYAIKYNDEILPLTQFVPPQVLLDGTRNTIVFENDAALRARVFSLFSTNLSPEMQSEEIAGMLCCLPKVKAPENIGYQNVFRVLILAFMDAVNFDVRAMKKSCVHMVQPDGKIIPFETYNIFHRGELKQKLTALRKRVNGFYRPNSKET